MNSRMRRGLVLLAIGFVGLVSVLVQTRQATHAISFIFGFLATVGFGAFMLGREEKRKQ